LLLKGKTHYLIPLQLKNERFHTGRALLKRFFFALLICLAIINMNGCSDPAKVASETTDRIEGINAVNKVTGQSILKKIALEGKDLVVRGEAIRKLTDHIFLVRIALEDEDSFIREAAFERLADQTLIEKISVEEKDKRVQLIYKVIRAFDDIDRIYRFRLMSDISKAIRILNYPDIENIFGEIISLETNWSMSSREYIKRNTSQRIEVRGEIFGCSIRLQNLAQPISHHWESDFPGETYDSFICAKVYAADLISSAFEHLPVLMLAKIALKDMDSDVQIAAIRQITDQTVLAKIALEDEDLDVQIVAIRQITDQTVLTKIALEGKDSFVCAKAKERINELILKQ